MPQNINTVEGLVYAGFVILAGKIIWDWLSNRNLNGLREKVQILDEVNQREHEQMRNDVRDVKNTVDEINHDVKEIYKLMPKRVSD